MLQNSYLYYNDKEGIIMDLDDILEDRKSVV